MSTSPSMEPADFATVLKAAVIYGSLTKPAEIFRAFIGATAGRPIVFRIVVVSTKIDKVKEILSEAAAPAPTHFAWVEANTASKEEAEQLAAEAPKVSAAAAAAEAVEAAKKKASSAATAAA